MDLIVDDGFYTKAGAWAKKQGDALNNARNKYYRIMCKVIEKGIKEGKTADALKEFVEQAHSEGEKGASNPWMLGVEASGYCTDYVAQIDEADEDLY